MRNRYVLLVYACQYVLSASTELNDSHYIEWNKYYLGNVIELDDYVYIWFLSRIHPQMYVSWYNSFICHKCIEFKKFAEIHLLLDIISRSVLALDHEHTLRDRFLRSRSQLIFMPLVPRGHYWHIVIFIKLTQVNREGNVFVRFIKRYLGGNDMRWVILQCNIPASLPLLIKLLTLRIPWCLLFQIPTSILFKTAFSLLSVLLRYLWIHSAMHIRPTKSYAM